MCAVGVVEEAVGSRAAMQLSRSWRCRRRRRPKGVEVGWVVHLAGKNARVFVLLGLLKLLEFFRVFPCDYSRKH